MAVQNLGAPVEFYDWLTKRKEAKGVSMIKLMRELPSIVERAEAAGIVPVTTSEPQAANARQVSA